MRLVLLAASLSVAHARTTQYEALDYESVADPKAVVTRGTARFTVLTPRLIRMEQAEGAAGAPIFEDRATLAVVNRQLPVPSFNVSEDAGLLTISTSQLKLVYKVGAAFSATSLRVSGGFGTWHFGERNDGNLLGTIKSLDLLGPISLNCTENNSTIVHGESLHCEWGVVSRSGWAIYQDESNFCLGEEDWWDGAGEGARNRDALDLYGFFHGRDYKGALSDFVRVSGRPAMVPRAAHGVWWTRWWDYNEYDARAIVEAYRSRSLPLDVFVLDMDWHRKNSWTGYSFDRSLFPDPEGFLAGLHDDGLLASANLHDDVGIGPWEDAYGAMARLMGVAPNATVPFTMCANRTYANGVEDVVLAPLESSEIGGALHEGGFDFWWIDWQQGGDHGGCAGHKQNPTIWTNKIRCTDAKRRAAAKAGAAASGREASIGRNMVLARFGGVGTQRYPVGFSGDVDELTWATLAYQPYYTLTSSNVGYGLWSHDIEGPAADPELFTRWVQWAALSPIFRSHERGMSGGDCADRPQLGQARSSCSVVEVWNQRPPFFEANRAAMQWRARHLPYIYSAARHYFDSGVSLLRPLYYEHPDEPLAYGATANGSFSEYYFGPDILAAPVVVPSEGDDATVPWRAGMASSTIWLPPGVWVEEATGVQHASPKPGGALLTKRYDLSEMPLFYRAGAVIATVPLVDGATIGTARQQYGSLVFDVYPGASSGATWVYEDDGASTAYLHPSGFSWLRASYSTSGTTRTFVIEVAAPAASAAASAERFAVPAMREITLRLHSTYPPQSLSLNGKPVAYARRWSRGTASWRWCGEEMALIVSAGAQPTASPLKLEIEGGDWAAEAASLNGVKGGVMHAILAKGTFDAVRKTVGAHTPAADRLKRLSSFGSALAYNASRVSRASFGAQVGTFKAMLQAAIQEVDGMSVGNENRTRYAKHLLASATATVA